MLRQPSCVSVTIGTTAADSTTIDLQHYAGGSFELPAGSGTTAITIYAKLGTDWTIAQDEDGIDLVLAPAAVVSKGRPLPSAVWNYPAIRLVASGGTATTDVPVFLKS